MTDRDSQRAARIAASFIAGLAVLIAVRAVDGSAEVDRSLLIAVVGSFGLSAVALVLPWQRFGRWSTLLLPAIAFVLFGVSLAGAESHANSYLLYPFGAFVWLGLAYPPLVATRMALPALAVATIPALAAGRPPLELLGYPVVFALGVAVAELLARIVTDLQTALDRTRSSDRARASLISTLAHDLRSPAATVAGSIRLLREREPDLDPEMRERLLAGAERQSERLLDLADSLVDGDRARGDALTLQLAAVDPAEIVSRAAWLTGIDVDMTGELDAVVVADRRRLQHVMGNLLDNAQRHGAPPVEVSIERIGDIDTDIGGTLARDAAEDDRPAPAEASGVRIEIRDHGPGIPDDLGEGVFDRFVHGGGPGSTGLGLWLVRSVVEAHGGSVRIDAADPGARVTVELPATSIDGG